MKIISVFVALTTIYLGLSICGFAQTGSSINSYQIGNKQIVVPPPMNFVEAASQIPAIKERFTATEAPGNDLLAVHLPTEHFQLFKKGTFFDLSFYTKVSVSKRLKNLDLTSKDFAAFVATFKKNFPAFSDPEGKEMKTILKAISENLTKLDKEKTTATISQPVNIGLIVDSANAYGTVLLVEMTLTTTEKENTRPLLLGMSAVRVREKIIFVYTYKIYEKEQDISEFRQFSKKWVEQIIAANN